MNGKKDKIKKLTEKFKGKVISPFKLGDVEYKVGDIFTTEFIDTLKHLINTKRITKLWEH